jgi:hypothetical protein
MASKPPRRSVDVGEEVVAAAGKVGVEPVAGFATTADERDFCFFLSVPVVLPGRRVAGWKRRLVFATRWRSDPIMTSADSGSRPESIIRRSALAPSIVLGRS